MIKVTENYYVQVDYGCFTIYEKYYNKRKEKEDYKAIYYPASLEKAIEKIMRYQYTEATNERDMSLMEALEVLKELNKEYQAILDEIREMEELE